MFHVCVCEYIWHLSTTITHLALNVSTALHHCGWLRNTENAQNSFSLVCSASQPTLNHRLPFNYNGKKKPNDNKMLYICIWIMTVWSSAHSKISPLHSPTKTNRLFLASSEDNDLNFIFHSERYQFPLMCDNWLCLLFQLLISPNTKTKKKIVCAKE